MVKRYGCAGILLFAMGLFPLLAQDNAVAKEMAIKIVLLLLRFMNSRM